MTVKKCRTALVQSGSSTGQRTVIFRMRMYTKSSMIQTIPPVEGPLATQLKQFKIANLIKYVPIEAFWAGADPETFMENVTIYPARSLSFLRKMTTSTG